MGNANLLSIVLYLTSRVMLTLKAIVKKLKMKISDINSK